MVYCFVVCAEGRVRNLLGEGNERETRFSRLAILTSDEERPPKLICLLNLLVVTLCVKSLFVWTPKYLINVWGSLTRGGDYYALFATTAITEISNGTRIVCSSEETVRVRQSRIFMWDLTKGKKQKKVSGQRGEIQGLLLKVYVFWKYSWWNYSHKIPI